MGTPSGPTPSFSTPTVTSRASSRASARARPSIAAKVDDETAPAPPPDDLHVIVIGGLDSQSQHDTTEILSISDEVFTPGPQLSCRRWGSAAILLKKDLLLVVGGSDGICDQESTELFDLATMTSRPGPSMRQPRSGCVAVRLDDRRILIAGGYSRDTCELLDTDSMKFSVGPRLRGPRACFGVLVLGQYRFMVAGGFGRNGCCDTTEVIDLSWAYREDAGDFDLERVAFTPGPRMAQRRGGCAMGWLDQRRALVVGGFDGSARLRTTEVLSVDSMSFDSGPDMLAPRSGATAVQLGESQLMIIGGSWAEGYLKNSEVLVETNFIRGPRMHTRRAFCASVAFRGEVEKGSKRNSGKVAAAAG